MGEGSDAAPALARRADSLAADLRRQQTDVEKRFWFAVRDRRLFGTKFRRQAPLGRYVVDFLCLEAKLIVELDGGQHGGAEDVARQVWLEASGYQVLRFWNDEVTKNLDGVLVRVAEALTPALSRREREKKGG